MDNSAGLQFFLSEDIYFLKQDMDNFHPIVSEPNVEQIHQPIIELPDPTVLVIEIPIVAEPPALYFKHLGNNSQQFLILCSYPDATNMDEKHLEALKSALQRKELALDNVAILNIANHAPADIANLNNYFKPARLLILGANARLHGWDKFALNQIETLDGTKVLYTYGFSEMMGDRDKTKAFWEQMKAL